MRAGSAEVTYLSLRRGVHVLKKRLGRKRTPIDQTLAPPWLPWFLKQKGFEVIRMRSGDVSRYGLPKPDHKVGHAHPTVSDGIHERLAAGAVTPKPGIAELRGDRVAFVDGTEVEADVIVYATGYRVSFPFFDPEVISAPGNGSSSGGAPSTPIAAASTSSASRSRSGRSCRWQSSSRSGSRPSCAASTRCPRSS